MLYHVLLIQIRMSHGTRMNVSCHTHQQVISSLMLYYISLIHVRVSHATRMNTSYHTHQ